VNASQIRMTEISNPTQVPCWSPDQSAVADRETDADPVLLIGISCSELVSDFALRISSAAADWLLPLPRGRALEHPRTVFGFDFRRFCVLESHRFVARP